MRYIVLALLFTIGCGDEDNGPAPCEVFDNSYSHSLILCGGDQAEHVSDSFVACNHRLPRSEQIEGCVGDLDLLDLCGDCFIEHVCRGER